MRTSFKALVILVVFIVASSGIYIYMASAAQQALRGWVTNVEGTQFLVGVNVSVWNTTDDLLGSNLTDSNGMYYFGAICENRLGFSRGRDILLAPAQEGERLNFFGPDPYIEVDGVPFTGFTRTISYSDG